MFGPLIHNRQVLQEIEREGGTVCENLQELSAPNVVVRAHGISRKKFAQLQEKCARIFDATCPFVKSLQDAARQFSNENFQVVILGQKDHPELRAICEDLPAIQVVEGVGAARRIDFQEKIALLSQTTQSERDFQAVAKVLQEKCRIFAKENTICQDVKNRQKAAAALAKEVDLMFVIGGRESANTRKIFQIVQDLCQAFQIESAAEIPEKVPLNFPWEKVEKVGICTGASTPIKVALGVKDFLTRSVGQEALQDLANPLE